MYPKEASTQEIVVTVALLHDVSLSTSQIDVIAKHVDDDPVVIHSETIVSDEGNIINITSVNGSEIDGNEIAPMVAYLLYHQRDPRIDECPDIRHIIAKYLIDQFV